jgi:hypothetical protein
VLDRSAKNSWGGWTSKGSLPLRRGWCWIRQFVWLYPLQSQGHAALSLPTNPRLDEYILLVSNGPRNQCGYNILLVMVWKRMQQSRKRIRLYPTVSDGHGNMRRSRKRMRLYLPRIRGVFIPVANWCHFVCVCLVANDKGLCCSSFYQRTFDKGENKERGCETHQKKK